MGTTHREPEIQKIQQEEKTIEALPQFETSSQSPTFMSLSRIFQNGCILGSHKHHQAQARLPSDQATLVGQTSIPQSSSISILVESLTCHQSGTISSAMFHRRAFLGQDHSYQSHLEYDENEELSNHFDIFGLRNPHLVILNVIMKSKFDSRF